MSYFLAAFTLLTLFFIFKQAREVYRLKEQLDDVNSSFNLVFEEKEKLKEAASLLSGKISLLERDYRLIGKTEETLISLALLYDQHESYLTLDDWKDGTAPLFSNFINYISELEKDDLAKLN